MEIEFENLEKTFQNLSCNYNYVPSAIEHLGSLEMFGIGLLSSGAILSTLTLYFAVDACHNIFYQKETRFYKTNCIMILWVYPVASVCSLTALGIPRTQLLSEAVTQIFLSISLYRLYLLLVYIGRKKVTKSPLLILRVGPCCCWPCLPFPELQMTDANLSWLRLVVLQLPIIQGLTYCIFLFMSIEEPNLATQYGIFFQPFTVASILVGIYGLTITVKSLQEIAPEAKLHRKATVSQMVLLFSKLQALIVKSLPQTGLFPCNPPITPQIYANGKPSSGFMAHKKTIVPFSKSFYRIIYLQCPDANRNAVALLRGKVRLLRRPGKGGRNGDGRGDRSDQRQEHGTGEPGE